MTVKELKHIIDSQIKAMPHYEDWEVVIPISESSVGGSPAVKTTGAGFGFDWDSGRFFVYPKEGLVKKDKKNRGERIYERN